MEKHINKNIIIAILLATIMIMIAFAGVYHDQNITSVNPNPKMVNNNITPETSVSNSMNISLTKYVSLFDLHFSNSMNRVMGNENGSMISVHYVKYTGNNPAIYGISITTYIGGKLHASLFELIHNGTTVTATIYPIYGMTSHTYSTFTVNSKTILPPHTAIPANVHQNSVSRGWLGYAILLNQHQTVCLIVDLMIGAAAAGAVAALLAILGVTAPAAAIAALVSALFALGVGYITLMDTRGYDNGINIDVISGSVIGFVSSPEYSIPGGF